MSVAFPSKDYANAAIRAIEVDPPFSETKSKKTTIQRRMTMRSNELSSASPLIYIDIDFTSNEDEASNLRTAISGFINNLSLVC